MFISLILSLLLSLACAQTNFAYGTSVTLSNNVVINGIVQSANMNNYGGTTNQDSTTVRAWLGIPYATAGRFEAPSPYDWSSYSNLSPFQANTFGYQCPQDYQNYQYNSTNYNYYNEDCLNLNIYAPNPLSTSNFESRLPVMVFIHGGSFTRGSGSLYDGGSLAMAQAGHNGVIVVTINYRLGALGWLATPSINGNFGFMDQMAALEWVRNEITNFGGDADRVTLAGHSAGGISVLNHMVNPESYKYFQQAIIHSGYAYAQPMEMATTMGQNFASAVGCAYNNNYNNSYYNGSYYYNSTYDYQRACLLSVDVVTLTNAGYGMDMMWGPVIDEAFIPTNPLESFMNGDFSPMPVLYGNTHDESSLFYCGGDTSADNYTQSVTNFINMMYPDQPDLVQKVLDQYPVSNSDPLRTKIDTFNIIQWFAGSALPLGFVTKYNYERRVLTYQYVVDFQAGFSSDCLGTAHGYELPFLFPNLVQTLTGSNYGFTDEERDLSYYMLGSWSRFVTDGFIEEWMPAVAFNFGDNGKWNYNNLGMEGRDAETEFMREDLEWFWDASNTRYVKRQNNDDFASASSLTGAFTLVIASILASLY